MQNLSVKRMLALSVVGRAIREIEADPKRGLRRIIDLGQELSHSEPRQRVIRRVQEMLKKPDSPCYALLSRAVREVDHKILQKFSVTLGWNCWTAGAQTLRTGEEELPWALRVTLDGTDDLRALRMQWKELRRHGVCALIADVRNAAGLQQALVLTVGVTDGAFLFLLPPELVTPAAAQGLSACDTLAVTVEDGVPETAQALHLLRENGCLYGVSHRCAAQETADEVYTWLAGLGETHGYFALLREQDCAQADAIAQAVREARDKQRFALLPVAEQADFQAIQHRIFS